MPRASVASEGIDFKEHNSLDSVNFFTPRHDSELYTIAEVPYYSMEKNNR